MGFKVTAVEATPNPNAKKFVLDRAISSETQSFLSAEEAGISKTATLLFAIPGVESVLLLRDFITINKRPEAQWKSLTPLVKQTLKAAD